MQSYRIDSHLLRGTIAHNLNNLQPTPMIGEMKDAR